MGCISVRCILGLSTASATFRGIRETADRGLSNIRQTYPTPTFYLPFTYSTPTLYLPYTYFPVLTYAFAKPLVFSWSAIFCAAALSLLRVAMAW